MVLLTRDRIDAASLREAVYSPHHGAVLVFEGVARTGPHGPPVLALEYEAYDEMAHRVLAEIAAAAEERWPVRVALAHRLGYVPVGEVAVVIAVGSPRRAAAYEASRALLEQLKEQVPVFKQEITTDGSTWKANAPA